MRISKPIKSGNSKAVYLTQEEMQQIGIKDEAYVKVSVLDNKIVIEKL